MAAPRAPWIALSCEMHEMSFRNGITDGRLRKIFKISCDENLVAIKAVLRPVKTQVIKLAVFWLKPAFCGNLVKEVSNFNFLSWVACFGKGESQHLHLGSFIELENRYHELLAFAKSMACFARDKISAQAQFVLPNFKALYQPLAPIPPWWERMRESAAGAFDYLLREWMRSNLISIDSDSDMDPDAQGKPKELNVLLNSVG
ncbi:hypothetical protein KI387_032468 [Taxus chinensis]|uniref:Uncharacterized protein n=1 Tax=Taxus chinensis TaxID=29808 RepID=A0AA38BQ54_TAXCH|nr:hypothetical protein KI387_032468 [Taxus chinensis]